MLIRLVSDLRKLAKLGLDKEATKALQSAYLALNVPRIFHSRKKPIGGDGFQLHYCGHESASYLFNELFINEEYHFLTTNKSPFIVDCGSNIGMAVLYFKLMYPDSQILAFEPDDDAFYCLRKNVEANNLGSVALVNKALSNSSRQIDFYYDELCPGSLVMSTIPERVAKHKKRKVEAVPLSAFIDKEVDFLKLDVEGAELDIVEELSGSGKLGFIKQMVIEYHHHIIKEHDMLSRMLLQLEDAGFGYQISGHMGRPLVGKCFQDILIYAYRKEGSRPDEPVASAK